MALIVGGVPHHTTLAVRDSSTSRLWLSSIFDMDSHCPSNPVDIAFHTQGDIIYAKVISSGGVMKRTVISLSKEDKEWLKERAARENISMAEVVRRAVHMMQDVERREESPTEQLLTRTSGLRSGDDGLEVQRRLRDEW